MRLGERHKRNIEEFNQLLPLLNKVIFKVESQSNLTNHVKEFNVNGLGIFIRLNQDIFEMALSDEKPIFPTLAFRRLSSSKTELLYYRKGNYFKTKLSSFVF